jgi:RNase P/RNase MRP subunit POP5
MLFVSILRKITSDFYGDIAVAIFCRWVVQYQLSVVQGLTSPAY